MIARPRGDESGSLPMHCFDAANEVPSAPGSQRDRTVTGVDVITAILLAGIFIAVVVYLLYWLYQRSSKEVSFVRTGFGGEKVVLSGGALVLPIVHNVTLVGMKTLRIEVRRSGPAALITKDRMRVEVVAEFYLRVRSDRESVAAAAQSLGGRTMDAEALKELVQGRFVDGPGQRGRAHDHGRDAGGARQVREPGQGAGRERPDPERTGDGGDLAHRPRPGRHRGLQSLQRLRTPRA